MKRRFVSVLLVACMVLSMMPVSALEMNADSTLCIHHPNHDESCGYVEAVEGHPCTHEHTDVCYQPVVVTEPREDIPDTLNDNIDSSDGEVDTTADDQPIIAEGEETASDDSSVPNADEADTTEADITEVKLDCRHIHDDSCGFVEAVEGRPCSYVCDICNEETLNEPAESEPDADSLSLALDTAPVTEIWDGTIADSYDGGKGTSDSPYLIKTAAQLARVAEQTNNGAESGKYYKLTADIYLNDTSSVATWDITGPEHTWTPIGNSSTEFSGTFDGCNHVIHGLYISTDEDYQGLFGMARGGSNINNIGIEDSYIKGGDYVGAIAGCRGAPDLVNRNTLLNCHNAARVTGTRYVGGIFGSMKEGYSRFSFENSYNTGEISGTEYVGGIIGGSKIAVAKNCYNTGAIKGTKNIGGIAGMALEISLCWNIGMVNGEERVGGILGEGTFSNGIMSTIIKSFNAGTVSGKSHMGGIVGYTSTVNNYTTSTISDCYNVGTLTGDGEYVAGIAGYPSYAVVTNCYNAGTCIFAAPSRDTGGAIYNFGPAASSGNLYFLTGCCGEGYHNGWSNVKAKSSEAMRANDFVNTMNNGGNAWVQDTEEYNSGYPILSGIDYEIYANIINSNKITLRSDDNFTVIVGNDTVIVADIPNSSKLQQSDITWASSDENVAIIESSTMMTGDSSASSTAKIRGVSKGSATITISVPDGRRASCDITVREDEGLDPENFNEYIYRANTALNGQDENYIRWQNYLQGNISGSDTPSKITADACKDSGYAKTAEGWTAVTTIFDSLVSSPTVGIKQMTIKQEDIYTAIILDSLECSYSINVFSKASKDTKTVREWSGWIFKIIKDLKGYEEDYLTEHWGAVRGILTEKDKAYITNLVSKRYETYGNLSVGSDFIKYIGFAFDLSTSVESFVENCFAYYSLLQTNEEMQLVIQKMYRACPPSNTHMQIALKNCNDVIEAGLDNFTESMIKQGLAVSGKYVAIQLIDTVWKTISKSVEALFPEIFVIKMMYKAGKLLANELFNADAQAEAYYKLLAVLEYENLGRSVMNDLASNFRISKTEHNAKMYLESATLNWQILNIDADYAIKFFQAMQKQPLIFLPEVFAGSSVNEVIDRMNGYKGLIENAQKRFDTFWILGLEEDYPELFVKYAFKLQESLNLEKQVTVSCPVNVYVYDVDGKLVAYIKDGCPYAEGNITAVVEGESKNFYFYDDGEYEMVCDGYNNGSMNIAINIYDEGFITQTVNYFDIPVSDNSTHRLEITSNDLVLSDSNEIFTPTFDSQSNGTRYTITINNGFATTNNTFEYTITAQKGEVIDISSYVPKEYSFNGWTSDSPSLIFDDASMPSTRFTMVDHDVVINAILSSATTTVHTITLNPNNGMVEINSIVSNGDGTLDALPIPIREDYNFDGWYTSPDGGRKVDISEVYTQDTTLYAHWTQMVEPPDPSIFTVTFNTAGGTVTPKTMTVGKDGKLSNLPIPIRTGYIFNGWYTAPDGGTSVTIDTIFTENTTVYAHWTSEGTGNGGGGSGSGHASANTYAVTVEKVEHGKVTSSQTNAARGSTVTLIAAPDSGYALSTLTVTDNRGKEIKLDTQGNGKYTFTMPDRAVTVKAVFASLLDDAAQPCDGGADCPSRSFEDLGSVDTWYHEAVDYVLRNGLMNGYTSTAFGPNDNLTRAQLAQILYNKEGNPAVTGKSIFTDVAPDRKHTSAVIWAAENGIVSGYGNGKFGPDDNITREQLAVMLWRYSVSPAATSKELRFNDADQISGYAVDALRWAVENGIVNGYGNGRLGPKGLATRAQVAQMLKNYLER